MQATQLEHINLTVNEPDKTAALFCHLFDWQVRWSGPAKDQGYTVHVGNQTSYLALYAATTLQQGAESYQHIGHLNHIGIVVDDLALIEQKVLQLGYTSFNHGDYAPGKRFYFTLKDQIEIEVISYR